MLIHLSSFCGRSKTEFWSRKTSGQDGLSEHRNCQTETILLNHKLRECGGRGGVDQNTRPICIWQRCNFAHYHKAPSCCLDGKESQTPPFKGSTRCMCFHLSSKMPERLNPLVWHQWWEISSQKQGMFKQ